MKWNVLNRRLHLYLALVLLPWFLLYGISSIPFAHPSWGDAIYKDGSPDWINKREMPFDAPLPQGNAPDVLKPLGDRIVRELQLDGNYGTYRQSPTQVNVYVYTAWHSTQVKYLLDQKKLVIEDRRFRWDQFLTGLHAQGGFEQPRFAADAWAVAIDFVCLGFLIWIVTGLVMWWQTPVTRRWGWVAIIGGMASFAVLVWML